VIKATHVTDSNARRDSPSRVVEASSAFTVDSVCNHSFASPCHIASSNNSVITIVLCGLEKRPLNTEILHYNGHQ